MAKNVKNRKERSRNIAKDLIELWNNFNFSHLSKQVIAKKVDDVLRKYDECVRRSNYDCLDKLFDMTKLNGAWLNIKMC